MTPRLNSFPPAPSHRRGFALLITITLLAFLVLLLVSLASLTRVETQVASNNQQLSQARQNALMALNIAIGQLQKTVGPDQRTTVRADLADPANVNGFTTLPKPGATRWTSAWGNANAGAYSQIPSQIESQVDAVTGSVNKPRILSWLVSGNEADAVTANVAGAVTSSANSSRFTPAAAISPASLSGATATTDTLTIADSSGTTRAARLLVGPNSVTTTNASYTVSTTTGSTYTASDYVVAPLIDIQAPAGSIPGFATAATIGRYAYWVGDENIKARANLIDNYLQQTSQAAQDAAKPYSAIVAQHSGIGFMDRDSSSVANPTRIGFDFNTNAYNYNAIDPTAYNSTGVSGTLAPSVYTSTLSKVLTPPQLPFTSSITLNPSAVASTSDNLQSALRNRFHDISFSSYSVLSDSYAGGLKKDLSAAFAKNATGAGTGTDDATPIFPIQDAVDYDSSGSTWSAIPTWGLLRSYSQARVIGNPSPAAPANNLSIPVAISVPTSTHFAIHPTICIGTLGISIFNDSGQIKVAISPLLGLLNTYTVQMQAVDAQFGFGIRTTGTIAFRVQVSTDDFVTSTDKGVIDLKNLIPSGAAFLKFPFNTKNISPGTVNLYNLNSTTVSDYSAGTNTMAQGGGGAADGSMGKVIKFPTSIALTPAEIASTNLKYRLINTGTGGKVDLVFATSTASLASLTPPTPTVTTGWYHTVQSVEIKQTTFTATTPFATAPETLDTTPKLVPTFVVRVQTMQGGASGLFGNNDNAFVGVDPNYALRWFAQANNYRAPFSGRTQMDTWTNGSATNPGNNTFGGSVRIPASTGNTLQAFINAESGVATAGVGYRFRSGNPRVFEVPRDDLPILSLGQLQNANLSRIDAYPTWAFGNSLADFRIPGNRTYLNASTSPANAIAKPGSSAFTDTYYDLSWHLNRALCDHYFFSGVPSGGFADAPFTSSAWTQVLINARMPLPNARMTYIETTNGLPTLSDIAYTGGTNDAFSRAARNLMVAGGFNINSPSQQAWRAVIGGTAYTPYRYYRWNGGSNPTPDRTSPNLNAPVPRSVSPNIFDPSTGINSGFTTAGTRELVPNKPGANNSDITAGQTLPYVIAKLARDIVTQVKIRGPFLSMGDFVNRRLVDTTASTTLASTGLKGTVQAGLDTNTNEVATIPADGPFTASLTNRPIAVNSAVAGWMGGSDVTTVPTGSSYILNHMRGSTTAGNESYKTRYDAGGPQFVTQADLISILGPALSARSDTFTIRTYGETVNPATGLPEGRAWCEAVVQRMPQFVDAKSPSNAGGNDPEDAVSSLNTSNRTFGRSFKIISFRWLTSNDI